jgi:hypothetical protein
MATAYIREYEGLAVTTNAVAQAGSEPGQADQTVTTSGTSAQSNAFGNKTVLIAISTPAAQAVCCAFGTNPTATTSNLRLPANSLFFFGVSPGHKVALIDVT